MNQISNKKHPLISMPKCRWCCDGASLPLDNTEMFGEYRILSSFPGLKGCSRFDIVWDTYRPDSLKATTREKRGKGTRRKMLSMYFAVFLQDATNKEELFNLPTEDVVKHDYPPSKYVYTTSGSHVKSNRVDISMSANDHKEQDSRICLHVDDALNEGATTVLVRTVDRDVVVILVGIFHDLAQDHPGIQ